MEICCDIDQMVRHRDLKSRYDAYAPDPAVVAKLREVKQPVTVAVIFGFWCPDSKRIVPEVLKAITEAQNENLQLLTASVPYEETDNLPLDVGGLSVRRFPTVVFLRGRYQTTEEIDPSQEICRFVEESLDVARLACV
jgi:hypothetical protein